MNRGLQAAATRLGDRPVIDQDIVSRLQALPESAMLDFFWQMDRTGESRLELLLYLGAVRVPRPAEWDFAAVRRDHERGLNQNIKIDKRQCFACLTNGQLYLHHILEVHHGGSNTPRNIVPLCFTCHQYLHPWLKEPPVLRNLRGFEHVCAVVEQVAEQIAGPITREKAS